MHCNDMKPRIKDKSLKFLHHRITSFSSIPHPLASSTQKVTQHLLNEVEEALDDSKGMAYNPRWRTMRKDIIEMIGEPRELLLNILHICGEISKLICERNHITLNSTKICIKGIKMLHNRLMILLSVGGVKDDHTDLHILLNCIHNLRHKRIKRIDRRTPWLSLRLWLRLWRSINMFLCSFIMLIISL
jgi:hypothetical protein